MFEFSITIMIKITITITVLDFAGDRNFPPPLFNSQLAPTAPFILSILFIHV